MMADDATLYKPGGDNNTQNALPNFIVKPYQPSSEVSAEEELKQVSEDLRKLVQKRYLHEWNRVLIREHPNHMGSYHRSLPIHGEPTSLDKRESQARSAKHVLVTVTAKGDSQLERSGKRATSQASTSTAVSKQVENDVIKALENPRYLWRTIKGVATEANTNATTVQAVLWKNRDKVVSSSRLSTNDEELYTTRAHFRKHAGFWHKFLGALKGRIN